MEPKAENQELNQKKPKKRKKIAWKSIGRVILLGIFLLVFTSIVAGIQIYNQNMRQVETFAKSYSSFIADNIDASQIPRYLKDGEATEEEYLKIIWALVTANQSGFFREIYLVVPEDDRVIYIADAYYPDTNLSKEQYLQELDIFQAELRDSRPYYLEEKDRMQETYQSIEMGENQQTTFVQSNGRELLATTFTPVYNTETFTPVAVLGMDLSLNGVFSSILRMFLNLLVSMVIIFTVGIVIFYYAINRSIIRPVVRLKKAATQELIQNLDSDQPFSVDIHTGDEIEDLADSIEEMDRNLKRYIKENTAITAERERLFTELDLAQRIQTDMLPNQFPPFPDRIEFSIFASMDPAKLVGGDFYDFFLIDRDHLGLVMADVSGKGIPAALYMMMAKIMIMNLAKTGISPKEVMERVNDQICESNTEEMFVTVWLGVLDLKTGIVTAVNAGHEFPVLKEPEGGFELVRDKHDFVIGGMPELKYREYELQMKPGSKLFLYTDGLPEATNAENEMFGTERMLSVLNTVSEESPETILPAVKKAVDEFVGDAPQFDDLTMMCVEYKG